FQSIGRIYVSGSCQKKTDYTKRRIEHEISNDGPRTLMFALVPEWITGKIVNEAKKKKKKGTDES
ncbi:MAG: hypothetical protein K5879_07620, partial [Lachnospiraceae bacterium]|nr:hypothetical protein [Lachnospiraceae bacterium]